MKTEIYVDGFNLYYGVLKYSRYKWLNIYGLFEQIIKEIVPKSEIVACNYYTAMVKARVASRGIQSVHSQNHYHRALRSPHTPPINLTVSDHNLEPAPLIRYIEGSPPDKNDRVTVCKLEEKQTDVRMALDVYRAATERGVDQVVIVSNDTDLVPVLEALEAQAPEVQRGIIIPRRTENGRIAAKSLLDGAHWARQYLRSEELAKHQFPARVPTAKKPADKPGYW